MFFKIYTKNPVDRNIQYTGYFNSLTSENLENYEVNIKFISQRTIKVNTDKIFYYAFSQNQTKTNYTDSWRTISIRYISNTTFELTLKRVNILNESENICYSATSSRWDYLKTTPTNTRVLWEDLLTKTGLQNINDEIKQYLTTKEINLLGGRVGVYLQTAQFLFGEMSFSGKKYDFGISGSGGVSYGLRYKIIEETQDIWVNSGIFTYFFDINLSGFDIDKFSTFLQKISGEELFISSFVGVYPNEDDFTKGGIIVREVVDETKTEIFRGVQISDLQVNYKKGFTVDVSRYLNNSQFAFLSVGGVDFPLFSSKITIQPLINVGKCTLLVSSCFAQEEITEKLPNKEFLKIFNKNAIILDLFSPAQLSKTNLSDYYTNPYAQKQLDFQIFNSYLSALPVFKTGENAFGIATKTFGSAVNLYGASVKSDYNRFKAQTTYNSASVNDFAKLCDIVQNQQKCLISYLPEITTDSATYMQPIAQVKITEKIFENYTPVLYHSITGERIDWTAKQLNMTAVAFRYNPQTILGFYKGELGNKITNNEVITINQICEEDKQTANEGVWLPQEENEILQLLTII